MERSPDSDAISTLDTSLFLRNLHFHSTVTTLWLSTIFFLSLERMAFEINEGIGEFFSDSDSQTAGIQRKMTET